MVQKEATELSKGLSGVTVVIMAWNEAKSIEAVVNSLLEECQKLSCPWELLLIDDGSTDKTAELAKKQAQGAARFRCIHHEANLGLGAVYRKAFSEAQKGLLIFFPGDGQYDAKLLSDYLKAIKNADIVLGQISKRNAPLRELILQATRSNKRIHHLAIKDLPRLHGHSKVNEFSTIWANIKDTLTLWQNLRQSPTL